MSKRLGRGCSVLTGSHRATGCGPHGEQQGFSSSAALVTTAAVGCRDGENGEVHIYITYILITSYMYACTYRLMEGNCSHVSSVGAEPAPSLDLDPRPAAAHSRARLKPRLTPCTGTWSSPLAVPGRFPGPRSSLCNSLAVIWEF